MEVYSESFFLYLRCIHFLPAVSDLICRSLIHLEFHFLHKVFSTGLISFFSMRTSTFLATFLENALSFFQNMFFFALLSKSKWLKLRALVFVSLILFHMPVFVPVPYYFYYYVSIIYLKIYINIFRIIYTGNLSGVALFTQDCFDCLWFLWFNMNSRIGLLFLWRTRWGFFNESSLNS